MKKSTLISLTFCAITVITFAKNPSLEGNLFLQLREISENNWGVFVITDETIQPSGLTQMGSGQVTLVAPAGFTYYSFKNHGGTWVENARVTNPVEAANKAYISFGFVMETPKLNFSANQGILLFSFEIDEIYNGTFSLFENGNDPFETPNSYGTNPGNELGMIDKLEAGLIYYTYQNNLYETEKDVLFSKGIDRFESNKARALLVSESEDEMPNPK